MRRFIDFLKTTAIGGLLVIVPIAIVLFVLAQLAYGLYSFTDTAVDKLNLDVDDALIGAGITALALIGLCFFTGLLVQTRLGQYLRDWFGRNVGRRIPMFGALSSLTKRFAGVESQQFAPIEVSLYNTDAVSLGLLVETLADGRCVVFVPSAPVATVGAVHIVLPGQIKKLDANVADTLTAITQWGVDTTLLYPNPIESQTGG